MNPKLIILLSGKAAKVWAEWQDVLEKVGNVRLGDLNVN